MVHVSEDGVFGSPGFCARAASQRGVVASVSDLLRFFFLRVELPPGGRINSGSGKSGCVGKSRLSRGATPEKVRLRGDGKKCAM